MVRIEWNELGNFGFLKDSRIGMDYLYDLSQLVEGNMYINPRLCAMYLRLLLEGFLDQVLEDYGIDTTNRENAHREIPMTNKLTRIVEDCNPSPKFVPAHKSLNKVFPAFTDSSVRLSCPLGRGDNKCGNDRNTTYCWYLVMHVGNAAAHPKVIPENYEWLKEEYIEQAIQVICNRMYIYFREKEHLDWKPNHFRKTNFSFATRQIIYNLPKDVSSVVCYEKNGNIPAFEECLCRSVIPINKGKSCITNKLYLVRKFVVESKTDIRTYLLHSQRAYILLQQNGRANGLAPFHVLAGLGSRPIEEEQKTATFSSYYVVSYEFDSEPQKIKKNLLEEMGVYSDTSKLKDLFHQIAITLNDMCEAKVYHRCLTHESVRILPYENGRFVVRLIDLELCKLFDEGDETVLLHARQAVTNYEQLNGCLRQYNGKIWDETTSEEEYEKEVIRRLGCLFANILCPNHLVQDSDYEQSATNEEIVDFLEQEAFANDEIKNYVTRDLSPIVEKMKSGTNVQWSEILHKLEG